MKKIILTIACALIALYSNAQKSEYAYIRKSWEHNDFIYKSKKEKEKIANNKINGYVETIKKGKKEYVSSKVSYDTKGNCISAIFNKENGKIYRQYLNTYSDKNKILSKIVKNKKGEEIKKSTYNYNQNGYLIETAYYKKGDLKSKVTSKLDSTRIMESYYFKNGNPDFKRKWVYSYYPDNSKKTSVVYKSNGKVLYTWNYECKPEGQLANKHKDTTAVCKKEEVDKDGNKTITTRNFNEKGKPFKMVCVYNKKDILIQYTTYNSKDILNSNIKYINDSYDLGEVIYYTPKGEERYKSLYMYDDNNNLTGTDIYIKGKLKYKTSSQFNSQNFVTNIEHYKKENKLEKSFKYDYLFF